MNPLGVIDPNKHLKECKSKGIVNTLVSYEKITTLASMSEKLMSDYLKNVSVKSHNLNNVAAP